ncbi:MAG: cation diffusion facilitator family transporter [Clostridia bacterium]|nr:cation diffusion facilitator family transporter [Clostridia bacterium]
MIHIFLRFFMKKQHLSYKDKVGISCSICGIILNLFQFIVKMVVGSISGSIAVTADAIHNLSDMVSSAVTLLSFMLSGRKTEYIAGFLISVLLFITAIQTAKSSILKIITPEPLVFSLFSVVMLTFSIIVKMYMAAYYHHYGIMINSQALKVTSTDCLCDSIATIIAAGAIVAARFTQLNVDGFGGVAVSVFILVAACKAAKDSAKELLNGNL